MMLWLMMLAMGVGVGQGAIIEGQRSKVEDRSPDFRLLDFGLSTIHQPAGFVWCLTGPGRWALVWQWFAQAYCSNTPGFDSSVLGCHTVLIDLPPACRMFDADGDQDVDLIDFAALQRVGE